MFKLYWWLICLGFGLCILFMDRSAVGLFAACGIACGLYGLQPETSLDGKFDGVST